MLGRVALSQLPMSGSLPTGGPAFGGRFGGIWMIDPRYMEFVSWAQRSVPQLEQFGPVPDAARLGGDWQRWALAVVQLPGIAVRYPPQPLTYADWRDWATHFILVMS